MPPKKGATAGEPSPVLKEDTHPYGAFVKVSIPDAKFAFLVSDMWRLLTCPIFAVLQTDCNLVQMPPCSSALAHALKPLFLTRLFLQDGKDCAFGEDGAELANNKMHISIKYSAEFAPLASEQTEAAVTSGAGLLPVAFNKKFRCVPNAIIMPVASCLLHHACCVMHSAQ